MLETLFFGIATGTIYSAFKGKTEQVLATAFIGSALGGIIMRLVLHS